MRVLYVSKASVVALYRDKLRELAHHVELHALVPDRWGALRIDEEAAPAPDAYALHVEAALLHGHNHLHFYPAAARVLRAVAPDIVHLDEEPYSTVTWQFARLCAARAVPFLFFGWQNLGKRLPPPFGVMQRQVFATAAAGIAGTPRALDVIRAAGFRGKAAVIPQLGVATAHLKPDPGARACVRRELGLPSSAFVAGYVGRLIAEKGVDLLLAAAASDPAMHVAIIGSGPARDDLVARSVALGIDTRTRFTGAVPSLEVGRFLNALDVLVLPSRHTPRWAEQFGRVLIEAMACGVPVVGADSGEIAHVIGDAGLRFPEGDVSRLSAALATLQAAPELRARLAACGTARVQAHFTQDCIAAATLDLYEQVLHERSPVPSTR